MAGVLQFDDATHTYTLGVVALPSVSSIIAPLVDLSRIPADVLDFARDRGKAVHKACELNDLNDLDESTLDERLLPYLAAWRRFSQEWGMTWTEIERPQHHEKLMYAGTPDRRGYTSHRMIKGSIIDTGHHHTVLVDAKATYSLSPAVAVQLSGYDLMAAKLMDELWSVRLKKDGTYERTVHKPVHSTFLSCLNIFRWKQRNA